MDNKILLTVIVPVYNVEKYLRQCLDSVVNQTFKDLEIILINDGSTDSSLDICKEYCDKDDRVVVIDQENAGLAAARQTGLDNAKGEYIAFVDSDDYLELDMYDKMLAAARSTSAEIVFCNVYRNEDKKEEAYFPSGFYDRKGIEEVIFPRLLASFDQDGRENTIRWCNWLRIYKKSLIDSNGIRFDKRFRRSQDLPFTFECTIYAKGYYYMGEEYLYHNRMNYESLSKGYTKNMWGLIKPLIQYLQTVVDKYTDYDFHEQMNKRAALFAFECCENENKPNNTRKYRERISTIKSIMRDTDAKRWVKNMDVSNMRRVNRLYRQCFIHGLANLFYFIARRRFKSRRLDYKKQNMQ